MSSPHSPGVLAAIVGHTLQAAPHPGIAITLAQSLGCEQVMGYSMFEKFWGSVGPKVRKGVRQRKPLSIGPAPRLFLSMTGIIHPQQILVQQQAVVETTPVGAIESSPVYRLLRWLRIFRANKDTDWRFFNPSHHVS